MDLLHKITCIVEKNSDNIPHDDYIDLCSIIRELRVKIYPIANQEGPLNFYDTPYEETLPDREYSGLIDYLDQMSIDEAENTMMDVD